MIILLLEKIAESSSLMTAMLILEVITIRVMQSLIQSMEPFGGAPDTWFAYPPHQLADWLADMTDEGCAAYHRMAAWDLFPYMEAYALLLGALLLQQTRAAGLSDTIAMIFPVVMVMDVVETILPAWACDARALSPVGLSAAAAANKYKWVLFGTGLMTLSVLFVYNTIFPKKRAAEEEKSD